MIIMSVMQEAGLCLESTVMLVLGAIGVNQLIATCYAIGVDRLSATCKP
jgi:hypothetical protein